MSTQPGWSVEQQVLLFDLSIFENIALADPSASAEQVEHAARLAQCYFNYGADGLHVSVGQRGRNLSGGQRQRVGIARTLLRDAPITVFDEPVASQDPETAAHLAHVVGSHRRRDGGPVTVFSSSHALSFFKNFDWAAVIGNRRLQEHGPVAELMERRGRYFQLVGSASGIVIHGSRVTLTASQLRRLWVFALAPAASLEKAPPRPPRARARARSASGARDPSPSAAPPHAPQLATVFTTRRLAAGELLCAAGEAVDSAFIVAQGRLAVVKPANPEEPAVGETLRTLDQGAALFEEARLD